MIIRKNRTAKRNKNGGKKHSHTRRGALNKGTPKHMMTCTSQNGETQCDLQKHEQKRWLNSRDLEIIVGDLMQNIMEIKMQNNENTVGRYYGYFPIDWKPCSVCRDPTHWHDNCIELANFQLGKNKHVDRMFFIFNLDDHEGPGTHWVALHVNTRLYCAHYYDSYGRKPSQSVRSFIDHLNGQVDTNFTLMHNHIAHQDKGGECGVFCVNFIMHLLAAKNGNDADFVNFIENEWTHNDMMYMRTMLFGPIWLSQYERENGHTRIPAALQKSVIWEMLQKIYKQSHGSEPDFLED